MPPSDINNSTSKSPNATIKKKLSSKNIVASKQDLDVKLTSLGSYLDFTIPLNDDDVNSDNSSRDSYEYDIDMMLKGFALALTPNTK